MAKVNPTVSVCIPTYNRAEMLSEAIRSVIGQTFHDFELIISDNASEDGTEAIVKSFRDKRILYVRNKSNIGVIKNFNQCLHLARGRYVTIFHDDDIMMPENLACKATALDNNPTVGFVHSTFHVIDANGKIVDYDRNLGKRQTDDYVEQGLRFVKRTVAGRNIVNPPSVMMRKKCYETVGGFSDRLLYAADYEYWMRIGLYYDVMFVARPLLKYRKHPGWGTAKFMALVDGSLVSTIQGLEEQYQAKRSIVEQARDVIEEWKQLRGSVRREMSRRIVNLIEGHMLAKGEQAQAREAIAHMCREFPEIMGEKRIIKLLLKCWLSDGTLKAVRRLKKVRGLARAREE